MKASHQKHILVIDDDAPILEAIQILLQESGHKAFTLSDVTNIVAEVSVIKPDLILLDLLLSGSDGRDVVRQLKAEPKTKKIPVVLMSADTYIKEKSNEVPVAGFIKKPFDIDELETVIQTHSL